jgi:murein DD-endopeptidase MepM/ murein hydrolase activator NlpD
VAAALVAGVGVAGTTTATTSPSSSPAAAQARIPVNAPAAPRVAGTAPVLPSIPANAPAVSRGAGTTPAPPRVPGTAQAQPATRAPAETSTTATASLAAPRASPDPSAGAHGIQVAGKGISFVRQARKRPLRKKPLSLWVNPLPEATTTSCYGLRWGRLHAGVDLAAPDGTPIRAAGAGVVTAAGPADGYGNAVLIDHGNGYLTHYGHLSAITVPVGRHVRAGDQVGNEGSTGHSTGPHLHFEVHEGAYQNPIEPTGWMLEHGVTITGCAPAAPGRPDRIGQPGRTDRTGPVPAEPDRARPEADRARPEADRARPEPGRARPVPAEPGGA